VQAAAWVAGHAHPSHQKRCCGDEDVPVKPQSQVPPRKRLAAFLPPAPCYLPPCLCHGLEKGGSPDVPPFPQRKRLTARPQWSARSAAWHAACASAALAAASALVGQCWALVALPVELPVSGPHPVGRQHDLHRHIALLSGTHDELG
jgi:hypothetical protein